MGIATQLCESIYLLYQKSRRMNLYMSRCDPCAMDFERLDAELNAIQALVSEIGAGLNRPCDEL